MSNAAQTFQAIVNERRSIRAFKSDPVEREVIDACVCTGTSCAQQL